MKKQYGLLCVFFVILLAPVYMQGVAISTTGAAPDSSAILDVSATNKGALFPRMTNIQRSTIPNPAIGLIIYNLDIGCYQYFDGAGWFDMCGEQKEKPLMLPWRTGVGSWSCLRNVFIDKYVLITQTDAASGGNLRVVLPSNNYQQRNYVSDWPDAGQVVSGVVHDSSLYLLIRKISAPQESRVYRYNLYSISSGGTQVTFSGLGIVYNADLIMTSNGTDIYFNYNSGNSGNDYIVARYSITSATTFTYQNSITCGGSFQRMIIDQAGNMYGGATSGTSSWYKYDSSGTFVFQTVNYDIVTNTKVLNFGGTYYMQGSESAYYYYKIWLE